MNFDLARVLRALGRDYAIDGDGRILEVKDNYEHVYELREPFITIDLNHPLHLQSPETITKLTELIK